MNPRPFSSTSILGAHLASSTYSASDIKRSLIAVFALVCAFGSVVRAQAHVGNRYKDPAGLYTVVLPANWQTQQEPGSQMVSFFDNKSQAFVYLGVIPKSAAKTPSANTQLDQVEAHLAGNCPQAKIKERGPTTLGGIPGSFLLVNCTNSKGGLETMRFAVANRPGLLLVATSASPAATYEASLPAIDSIEQSLTLLTATSQADSTQGGLPTETSQTIAQSSNPKFSGSGVYRDPGGRYSLTVPADWSAEPPANSGVLQLSSGPNWAMIVAGGGEPREVNHQVTQQIQAQFTGFQLLNEGELKINGHPSHGTNATGMNPKGEGVSVLVLTIGAGNGHVLTVISSSPNKQAKGVNDTIMKMAQSIRFEGK